MKHIVLVGTFSLLGLLGSLLSGDLDFLCDVFSSLFGIQLLL